MSRTRMLTEVEFPLALPVIVAGLRVALVETTAGAIVAGLVGGGVWGRSCSCASSGPALSQTSESPQSDLNR